MNEDFRAKVLLDDDSLVVEYEAQKKRGMKWDRHLTFITEEIKEIPLYNSERSDNQFRFCWPPVDVPSLLWRAWTLMRHGAYNPNRRATVKEIIEYLRARCVSEEAALWAAKKADEYYDDKFGFEEFVKRFRQDV